MTGAGPASVTPGQGTVRMRLSQWRLMLHYTGRAWPPIGAVHMSVYARGPDRPGSDPTTDDWYFVEVRQDGYLVHHTATLIEVVP